MSISPRSALAGTLDEVLAAARGKGLSQKDLAVAAGVRAETIARAKKRGTVDFDTLQALARAAGIDLQVRTMPAPGVSPLLPQATSLADPALKLAWSNPNASGTALIAAALKRAQFDLILLACLEHGVRQVRQVLQALQLEGELSPGMAGYVERSLRNIAIGEERARQPAPSPAH